VPFKYHSRDRHHIPCQKHGVANWRDYDAALRNHGSLTIWFTEDAIANWKAPLRTTPGGQRHYSDLAIETALTLRAVFRLALRQSEGLIGSVMKMLNIDLPVPDHTTLSRRACGLAVQKLTGAEKAGPLHLIVDSTGLKLRGAGEWLFEKHGTTKRRAWRKLHIGIDADSGERRCQVNFCWAQFGCARLLSGLGGRDGFPLRHRLQAMKVGGESGAVGAWRDEMIAKGREG